MNARSYKLILFLLSFCILFILALQGYWLRHFYLLKKDEFEKTVYAALENLSDKLQEHEQLQSIKMTYLIQNGDTIAKTPSRRMLVQTEKEVQVINRNIKNMQTKQFFKHNKIKVSNDSIVINGGEENVNVMLDGKKATVHINHSKKNLANLIKESTKIEAEASEINKLVNKMMTEIKIIDDEKTNPDTLKSVIKKVLATKGLFMAFEFRLQKKEEGNKDIVLQSTGFDSTKKSFKSDLSAKRVFNNHQYLMIQFPTYNAFVFSSIKNMLSLSLVFSFIIMGIFYYTLRLILNQKKLSDIKNDFVNNMTHELKTPIATMSLAIDGLNTAEIKNNETRFNNYTNILKEENQKLNTHVERVLQMALLDKGNLVLNKTKLNLPLLLENVIKTLQLQINEKKALVVFRNSAKTPFIHADEMHLNSVFMNLLDNALKYSKENCVIEIDVMNLKSELIVSIKDNGIGIDAKNKEKVFDKFYRVQGGNLHDVKGFGLGLSYAKSILEAHEANIEVFSELKKGSEFIIHFKQDA